MSTIYKSLCFRIIQLAIAEALKEKPVQHVSSFDLEIFPQCTTIPLTQPVLNICVYIHLLWMDQMLIICRLLGPSSPSSHFLNVMLYAFSSVSSYATFILPPVFTHPSFSLYILPPFAVLLYHLVFPVFPGAINHSYTKEFILGAKQWMHANTLAGSTGHVSMVQLCHSNT